MPRRKLVWRRPVVSTLELTIKWFLENYSVSPMIVDSLRKAGVPKE